MQRAHDAETNTRAIPWDAFEKRGVASNGSSSPSLQPFSVPLCSCAQHLVQPCDVEDSVQATPPSERRCCLEMLDRIDPLTPNGPNRHNGHSRVMHDVATVTANNCGVEDDACCTGVSVFMESSCTREHSESSVPRVCSLGTEVDGVSLVEAVVCREVDRFVKKDGSENMGIAFGEEAKRAASISHVGSGRFF